MTSSWECNVPASLLSTCQDECSFGRIIKALTWYSAVSYSPKIETHGVDAWTLHNVQIFTWSYWVEYSGFKKRIVFFSISSLIASCSNWHSLGILGFAGAILVLCEDNPAGGLNAEMLAYLRTKIHFRWVLCVLCHRHLVELCPPLLTLVNLNPSMDNAPVTSHSRASYGLFPGCFEQNP